MYCKNCGNKLEANQKECFICGLEVGEGDAYCPKCGSELEPSATFCVNCGYQKSEEKQQVNSGTANSSAKKSKGPSLNGKDKITTALLCFFLGAFGVHNFYMGENKKGIMKIVFFVLCGISAIFALIDFVKILTDSYTYDPDANF